MVADKKWCQHHVYLMACFSLLTKIHANFLVGFYLLNLCLTTQRNLTQKRYPTFKTTMKFTFLLLFTLLISCGGKLTKGSCDFEFFEKISELNFPKNVEIINCGDSLEGDIWVHLQFSEKDASDFITKMDFHSYSNDAEYIEEDTDKILPFFPDNNSIETFEQNMSEKYVEIPKTDLTFIATISKEKQYLIYILNVESGLFWGHIAYPDWSGDF